MSRSSDGSEGCWDSGLLTVNDSKIMTVQKLVSIWVLVSISAGVRADPAEATSPSMIQRLIREAVRSHPLMAAASARAEGAIAGVGAVRLWDDPQLGIGGMAAERMMREQRGDIVVGIAQKLPRQRLYEAEKRHAEAGAKSLESMRREVANELGLSVAQALLELALADELIRLQEEDLGWLDTIVNLAQQRAKDVNGSAAESLRLESERAVREQVLASLRRQRGQYALTLNLMLGRVPESPWHRLSLAPESEEPAAVGALRDRLVRHNPQLDSLRKRLEGATAGADVAHEMKRPMFSVGVDTRSYSGGAFRETMVSLKMSLPWLNRSFYSSQIEVAEKSKQAAASDLAAQQIALYTTLSAHLTDQENNRQLVKAYAKEVLPKSVKTVETLQNAWVSSAASLLDVLEARRSLLTAWQTQMRAVAAQNSASYALAALVDGLIESPKN